MLVTLLAIVAALTTQTPAQQRATVPWQVGERLDYQIKFTFLNAGTGSMEVIGIEQIRGRDAWHTQFRLQGGKFGYDVAYLFDSWGDVTTLASMRFHSDADQNGKERVKRYEIFPDRSVFVEETPNANGTAEQRSVQDPLDDGSFLYFVRTVPLEVGRTYEFQRYFRPDRNPVTIKVLKRERIKVPAGEFQAIVIQPIINTPGKTLFSKGGNAQIWLSDDANRYVLQMKTNLVVGSIGLYLKSVRPASR
jgi:uncharacterized protein DUF3108